MKRLFIFPFIFLFNIVKRNILKTIWIALAIIGFHFSKFMTRSQRRGKLLDELV